METRRSLKDRVTSSWNWRGTLARIAVCVWKRQRRLSLEWRTYVKIRETSTQARTVATLSHTHGLSACYPSHLVMSSHHGDSGSIALSSLPVCFAPTPALRGFILVSLLSPRACLLVCRIITYVHPSSDGLLCLVHTHTAILAKVPRQFHSSTLHGPLGFSSSPSLRTTLIRAQSPCR